MKKLLAMALALVMCLGVTTMAWAEETGYNKEALPTGPDMSGTVITVTPENAQYTLDGAYGSIDNKTVVLSAGTYSQLELGRATKYADSGTKYYICNGSGFDDRTEYTFANFYETKNNGQWSGNSLYVRSMTDVTIKAADGAAVSVAGIKMVSGHQYGSAEAPNYDYVLERSITDNGGYYLVQKVSNLKFEGITFTGQCNIDSSLAESVLDGVTFTNCTFNINNTASGNQAIRYYNEKHVATMKNLKVYGCEFNQCYQGVYANGINGVEVVGCAFNTTGHNAIAVQSNDDKTVNGAIIIKENYINGAGDRAIRLGDIGAESTITVNNNIMVNSGDGKGELFKASTIAEGASTNLENNYWNGKDAATAVANESVRPTKTGITGGTFKGEVKADMLAEGVEAVKNADGSYTVAEKTPPRYYYNSTTTTDTKKDDSKSSPKTFDAGVGIYAVSAVLSVTGMAYVGKKKF